MQRAPALLFRAGTTASVPVPGAETAAEGDEGTDGLEDLFGDFARGEEEPDRGEIDGDEAHACGEDGVEHEEGFGCWGGCAGARWISVRAWRDEDRRGLPRFPSLSLLSLISVRELMG